MKVALIIPGGVDRTGTRLVIPCLLWLIERLARDVDLHVFALRQEPRPSRYPLLGAHVHNIGARPRRVRALASLLAEHRRAPFDLLHAVWAAPPGVIAAVAGRMLRRPVLLGITGGDLAAVPQIRYGVRHTRRGRAWLRLALLGASRVTVPSRAMQQSAQALGIRATLLPLGVALDRWPPLPVRAREPDTPARLLHIGTLNRVKDQGTLLRAVRRLADQDIPFHLDIIGEDVLGGAVQRLAHELALDRHVTFHGLLDHDRLRPFFEQAHLLLVSSLHEADPIVVLEAAVAGVPTVGTAVGHVRDWNGTASVAVPTGDATALATETRALLADDARRLRLAAEAQRRALECDADWTARRMLDLYESLIG